MPLLLHFRAACAGSLVWLNFSLCFLDMPSFESVVKACICYSGSNVHYHAQGQHQTLVLAMNMCIEACHARYIACSSCCAASRGPPARRAPLPAPPPPQRCLSNRAPRRRRSIMSQRQLLLHLLRLLPRVHVQPSPQLVRPKLSSPSPSSRASLASARLQPQLLLHQATTHH